jgi:hypothetical protein
MLASGESRKEVILPDFNQAIMMPHNLGLRG